MIYVFWGSENGSLSYHGTVKDFGIDEAIERYQRILSEQLLGGGAVPERMMFFQTANTVKAVEVKVYPGVVLRRTAESEPDEAAAVRAAHDSET